MAFSATVRGSVGLGGPGGLTVVYGDWSGNAGDAAGTLTISGGDPVASIFTKYDAASNTNQLIPAVSTAYTAANTSTGAGAYTTVTVQNQDNVTTGHFIIFQLGR